MKVFNKNLIEWLSVSLVALILSYAIFYKFLNIHGEGSKEKHPYQGFVIK